MNARPMAVVAPLAAAVLVVASAVGAQDAGVASAAAGVDADPAADVPDAAAAADVGASTNAAEAADGTPGESVEVRAMSTSANDAPVEARRGGTRRREAALVGGWVASSRDPASSTVLVDDLVLGANGEWTRRISRVGSDQGLLAPPAESSGTWFTEAGTVVLLDRGSAADEVLRSPYSIDDRSEQLTLESDEEPLRYYRYR